LTINIILDVGTGVDDAFAILYATRNSEIKVLGITCVDGNTGLEQVCKNTLQVLDMAGAYNIPVAAGAALPLMGTAGELAHASHVHGGDGLAVMMYGLDVFYDLKVDETHVKTLREFGSTAASFAADLIEFRLGSLGS
jgi:inosine-uridine nucleoside N-ribohydrolase